MKLKSIPKIIFTGGGSGGHLSIMKALIEYLRKLDIDLESKILVVGGKLGMIQDPGPSLDERRIPEFGVPYTFIRGGKLHRALKWMTLKLVWGFFPGLWDSYRIIKDFNPEIIFATGGYVSLPMVIIGKLLGKKVVIHEQTLTAGLSNKIGAFFADKVLVTFDESKQHFPPQKTILTGNAVNDWVVDDDYCKQIPERLVQVIKYAKKENKPIIYITGGSQGAHKINLFFLNNLISVLENYALVWGTGENELYNDFYTVSERVDKLPPHLAKSIYYSKYIKKELGYILKNADLVVCRPGANTLYELAVVGKKALMIPLWVTSTSDQETNARWFCKNYTGAILHEKEMNLKNFKRSVKDLMEMEFAGESINIEGTEQRIMHEILTE
ncbi:hypothetical protein GF362_01420 [Candidatus Dojkabacteria bacterium]|nr:hypothetical protein [Candidatus Dojkabacteria bacterium]